MTRADDLAAREDVVLTPRLLAEIRAEGYEPMNAADRHWILERAKRVLRPGDYDELEAALRSSSRTDEADASLNTGPGPSGKASEQITEGELRFLHGDR